MQLLADEKIREFFGKYPLITYKKGERMIREHDNPSHVLFLASGIARAYLISQEGNELTALLYAPSSIFPTRGLLASLPNIYNFDAVTDVEVRRAPEDETLDFIDENADVLALISQQLIQDQSALIYRLQHTVFGNAQAKVAAVIVTLAVQFSNHKESNDNILINMPFTHQQIADSAGITRETASLEMKKLENSGLIGYKGRTLLVKDLVGLRKISYL